MGGRVQARAVSGSKEDGFGKGADGSLPIGASHMETPEVPFGVAQFRQKTFHRE